MEEYGKFSQQRKVKFRLRGQVYGGFKLNWKDKCISQREKEKVPQEKYNSCQDSVLDYYLTTSR